ncbi:phosphotransferase family protein [Paenibacillus cremeus]|uniref:Aminoglycoside phosphotransferase family protein n=1 Tax=Paenibacillus cremeus TaxID=2163881 RepID=A0A559JVS4_9BACL|nr:aminoglycoside phosphotransferase family protein [Paenibacillus cremeus]TVY04014.1 aminoglycoside phosphotransferase family protein [Paenibacillus cremeus]
MADIQSNVQDPILDDALVLSLVRRHVPEAQSVTGIDETGGEARTYAVDELIILKTQRPHKIRPSTSLEKEAFFLRELEKYPDISVPRVLGYGREGSIEYTCMSRIPGIAVKYASLAFEARNNMLIELGKRLRRIHGAVQQPFIESGLFPGDRTFEDTKTRLKSAFDKEIGKIVLRGNADEIELAQGIATKALAHLPDNDVLVAVHANPATTHTFVDPETGHYTGTIDFGDAYISHPVFDLRRWGLLDRGTLLAGYVSEKPVSEEFMRVWDVVQILDSFTVSSNKENMSADLAAILEKLS